MVEILTEQPDAKRPEEERSPEDVGRLLQLVEQLEAARQRKKEFTIQFTEKYKNNPAAEHIKEDVEQNLQLEEEIKNLEEAVAALKDKLKGEGWVFGSGYGFKVDLVESAKGVKMFEVADSFGELPADVKEGSRWPANSKLAHTIPETVRHQIIDLFTFGKNNEAIEYYHAIPDSVEAPSQE